MLKYMRSQSMFAIKFAEEFASKFDKELVRTFPSFTLFTVPVLLWSLPMIAMADNSARSSQESAALSPIFVEADQFKVFFDQEKAVWRGNVEATQGNYTFHASSLTVHMDQVQTTDGTSGSGQSSTSAPGPGFELQADALSYDIDTDRIVAHGNSELRRGVELIRAEKIIYQVAERLAIAQPQANGRVQVQFFSNPNKPLFHTPRAFDEHAAAVTVAAE